MNSLIEIRCPQTVKTKHGQTFVCNKLLTKVYPGSSGEAYCDMCRKTLDFEIKSDYQYTQTEQTRIRVDGNTRK